MQLHPYQGLVKRALTMPVVIGIADGMVIHRDKIIYQAHKLKVGLIRCVHVGQIEKMS